MLFEGTKGKLMAGLFGRNPTLLPTQKMKDANLPKSKFPFVEKGAEGHQTQWVQACKKALVPIPVLPSMWQVRLPKPC